MRKPVTSHQLVENEDEEDNYPKPKVTSIWPSIPIRWKLLCNPFEQIENFSKHISLVGI